MHWTSAQLNLPLLSCIKRLHCLVSKAETVMHTGTWQDWLKLGEMKEKQETFVTGGGWSKDVGALLARIFFQAQEFGNSE